MAEYLNRGDLIRLFEAKADMATGTTKAVYNAVCKMIALLPDDDVEEVRHGEWVQTTEPLGWGDVDCIECSSCRESWIIDEESCVDDYNDGWKYCPNCGAKMEGK